MRIYTCKGIEHQKISEKCEFGPLSFNILAILSNPPNPVAVEKHFEDFAFDQFDFHSYCIRKYTLRSYVAMIRFEDEIWGKKFYTRAAEGIIKTYLHLHENPIKEEKDEEPDFTKMTSAEKKRWKQDERKRKGKIAKKKEEEDSKKKKEEEDAKKEEKEKADAGKTEEEVSKRKAKRAAIEALRASRNSVGVAGSLRSQLASLDEDEHTRDEYGYRHNIMATSTTELTLYYSTQLVFVFAPSSLGTVEEGS